MPFGKKSYNLLDSSTGIQASIQRLYQSTDSIFSQLSPIRESNSKLNRPPSYEPLLPEAHNCKARDDEDSGIDDKELRICLDAALRSQNSRSPKILGNQDSRTRSFSASNAEQHKFLDNQLGKDSVMEGTDNSQGHSIVRRTMTVEVMCKSLSMQSIPEMPEAEESITKEKKGKEKRMKFDKSKRKMSAPPMFFQTKLTTHSECQNDIKRSASTVSTSTKFLNKHSKSAQPVVKLGRQLPTGSADEWYNDIGRYQENATTN